MRNRHMLTVARAPRRTRHTFTVAAMGAAVIAAALAGGHAAASASTCTQTGFYKDGINMTAAVVNPSAPVTGIVDASGCNVGVYFGPGSTGTVTGATVENANYYGILNDGGAVNITFSTVTNIGEAPFNGTQHGVGIYWPTPGSTGIIKNNTVTRYQKGGIVVRGTDSSVTIANNTVTGLGPIPFIAQNGIQMGGSTTGTINNNIVTGNEYTGTNYASSAGILIVGGDVYGWALAKDITINNNIVSNNDMGVALYNANADYSAPSTPTNDSVINNKITKTDGFTNISGYDGTCGYQAGVSDFGNGDSLSKNKVSGTGYAPSTCDGSGNGMWSAPYDYTGSTLSANDKNKIRP